MGGAKLMRTESEKDLGGVIHRPLKDLMQSKLKKIMNLLLLAKTNK